MSSKMNNNITIIDSLSSMSCLSLFETPKIENKLEMTLNSTLHE